MNIVQLSPNTITFKLETWFNALLIKPFLTLIFFNHYFLYVLWEIMDVLLHRTFLYNYQ